MNEEVKETVLKLSDYTETINQKIKGSVICTYGYCNNRNDCVRDY